MRKKVKNIEKSLDLKAASELIIKT